jgi:hypothetical protein
MKKIIEKLERAFHELDKMNIDVKDVGWFNFDCVAGAWNILKYVLAELKSPPRWYTPEQWEQWTGKKWLDRGPVYYRAYPLNEWSLLSFEFAKYQISLRGVAKTAQIVCATEAGPPPDDWRPEDE